MGRLTYTSAILLSTVAFLFSSSRQLHLSLRQVIEDYALFETTSVPGIWTLAGLRCRLLYALLPAGKIRFECLGLYLRRKALITLPFGATSFIGGRITDLGLREKAFGITYSTRLAECGQLKRYRNSLTIQPFNGTIDIADLECGLMDEATKKRLAVAGTEYQRLSTGRHHVRVSGVIKEQTRGKDGLSSSTHWVQKAPVLLCDRDYFETLTTKRHGRPLLPVPGRQGEMIDDAEMACCGREVGCWVPDLKSFALVSIEDVESYTPDPSLLEKIRIDPLKKAVLESYCQPQPGQPTRLILLVGKSGTGKTALASACAAQANVVLASYRAEAEELRSLFQHESILATLGAFALIESVDTLFHKDSNTLQKWLSVLTGTGVSVVFCTTTHPEALATPFLEAMTCILHLPVPETSIDKRAVWLQNLADVGIDVHSGAKNGKIGVREAELFSLIANDTLSPREIRDVVQNAKMQAAGAPVTVQHLERALKIKRQGSLELHQAVSHHEGRSFYS